MQLRLQRKLNRVDFRIFDVAGESDLEDVVAAALRHRDNRAAAVSEIDQRVLDVGCGESQVGAVEGDVGGGSLVGDQLEVAHGQGSAGGREGEGLFAAVDRDCRDVD